MSDLPTSEDIQNLNSQMSQFNKAVTDLNKNLLKSSKHFNNIKNSEEEINKQANKAKDILKSNNKLVSSMAEGFQGAASALADAVKPLGTIGSLLAGGGIAAFTTKIVKDTINLDNTTSRLAARLGKQVQKAELKGAVNAVQKELGAAYEDAVQLVSTLSEARYTDNLKEAAKGAEAFGRFTGVGASETATLMNELNKGAGMSTDSINAMLAGMMKVQNNVGLSKAGMSGVSEYIKKAAINMAAFGKSSTDIQRMATQTTALVASLEKVGVAAGDATELVDRLTDPDRIEDNILLYSQLGVSMEDALSGNVDLSSMDNQLKDMAQRIVDMGPIAGAQFAKSMGMTYKQATQMAKMEGSQVGEVAEQAQTTEEGAIDAMKELEKQAMGVGEKTEKFFNKIEGRIRGLPLMIQLGLGLAASYAIKKIKEVYSAMNDKKQASITTDAVGSSIAQGFSKGLEIAKEKTSIAAVAMGRQIKQSFDSTKVGAFFDGTDKRLNALIAKAKKETFADIYFGTAFENKKNALNAYMKDYENQIEALKKTFSGLGGELDKSGRFEKTNGMTTGDPAKDKALKAIIEKGEELEKLYDRQKNKLEEINKKYSISAETQNELKNAAKEVEKVQEKIEKNEQNKQKASERLNQIKSKTLDLEKRQNAMKAAGLSSESKEWKLLDDELKTQKQLAHFEEIAIKAADEKIKKQKINLDLAEKELKTVQQKAKDEAGLRNKSGIGKVLKGFGMKADTGLRNAMGKTTLGQGYSQARAEGKGKMSSIGAGVGKVMAKGFGSITKMLGPMAIVMAVFGKLIDKVKEPLQKIMDGLIESLSPIVDVLVGILGPVLNTLIKAFMPPILRVTATILQMLHYILWPLKAILRLLGKLPFFKENNPFTAVADALDAITGDAMVGALNKAADTIAQGGADIKEAAEKEEDKAATIKASGGDLIQVESASVSSKTANSQASSTTQTTTESKSDSQLKEMENAKKEKADKKHKATIEEQLILAVNKLVEISNKLDSNLSKPNPWEGAGKTNITADALTAVE